MTATPQPEDFSELLDQSQWTKAATFAQDDAFAGPSDRIARYYRQSLNELDSEGLDRKEAERTAPASEKRAAARAPRRERGACAVDDPLLPGSPRLAMVAALEVSQGCFAAHTAA